MNEKPSNNKHFKYSQMLLLCLNWTSLAHKLKYEKENLGLNKLEIPPSSTNNPQGIPSPKTP